MAFEVSLSYIAPGINNRLHKYSHFRALRTKVVRRPHGYWISWPSYLQGSLGVFFAKITLILTILSVWLKEAGHFPWSQIVTAGNTCTYLLVERSQCDGQGQSQLARLSRVPQDAG